MDFDFRQLEVFARVVEQESFTKAARVVHLSQATVSERVAALEEAIGAKLLNRKGGTITPTEVGALLYSHARELLRARRQTVQALQELLGLESGELRLGGSTIPAEYVLPELLGRFRESHPGVSLRLAVSGSAEIARRVEEGDLELGIIGAERGPKSLIFDKLWEDELVLIVPPSHPWTERDGVGLVELSGETFIEREEGSGTRFVLERRLEERETAPLGSRIQLGSSTAVKEAVKKGLGVTIISRRAVVEEVEAGKLVVVKLEGPPILREFFLIRDRRRALSPPGTAFVEFLKRMNTA